MTEGGRLTIGRTLVPKTDKGADHFWTGDGTSHRTCVINELYITYLKVKKYRL